MQMKFENGLCNLSCQVSNQYAVYNIKYAFVQNETQHYRHPRMHILGYQKPNTEHSESQQTCNHSLRITLNFDV